MLILNLAVTVLILCLTIYVYLYPTRLLRLDRSLYTRVLRGMTSLVLARVFNCLILLGGGGLVSDAVLRASVVGEFLGYSLGAILLLSAAFKLWPRVSGSFREADEDYQWRLFRRTIPNILRPDGNPDRSVGTFLAYLRHAFGYDAISIHLLEDSNDFLKLWQSVGMEESWWHLHRQILVKGSIAGAVIDRGRVIIVEELEADPQLKKLLSPFGDMVSFFGCPLKFGEKSVGVFSIYSRKPRRFERIEVRTLVAAVDQLATILAFQELSAEVSTKERRDTMVARLEEVAVRHSELRTGLPGIASILKEYIPCDYLCLLLLDRSGHNMSSYTASAEGSNLIEKKFEAPELSSTLRAVIEEGQSRLLNDCRPHAEELKTLPFSSQAASMMLSPLPLQEASRSGSRSLRGALICASKIPGDFSQQSLELLRAAAAHVTLIAQKDLIGDQRETVDRGLRRLSRRIASDLPPPESTERFGQVAEAVVTGLPATSCRVMRFDSPSSSFKPLGSFHRQATGQEESRLQPIPLRESPLLQRIVTSRRPMTVDTGPPDALLAEKEHSKIFGADIKGGLILPVTYEKEVCGLLTVGERRNPLRQPLTDDDLEFCEGVASQLAPVLSRPLKGKVREDRLLEVVVESLPDLIFQMRSPLTIILGNCELMSRVQDFATPEQTKRFVRTVENSAKKLHRSLETLSSFHSSVIPPRKEKIYDLDK